MKTTYRACHLCEALCGLEIRTEAERIVSIKGDKDDPFSRGHVCPKAVALQDIHTDPDRLRAPVRRVGNEWESVGWDAGCVRVGEDLAGVGARAVVIAVGL